LAYDGPGCSVKDSFGTFELARWGFDELFQARWILREPVPSSAIFPSTFSVVETEEDCAAWAAAHGALDTFGGNSCVTHRFESSLPTGRTDSVPGQSLTARRLVSG
jgi:hypothetical protein